MLAERKQLKISINYEMCKECNGFCCRKGPCQYLPLDFDSIEAIEDEIEKNYAIIDKGKMIYTGEQLFFLRVRTTTEDLTSSSLLLPKDNIYLATEESRKRYKCMFYKWKIHTYYLGIEYDKYDEEKLRNLTKKELRELFDLKIRHDQKQLKFQTMEQNIQDYLEMREKEGWGGCLLPPGKRPGGALYTIPDYQDGVHNCKGPLEFQTDNWDKPEHQEKLVKILSKRGLL